MFFSKNATVLIHDAQGGRLAESLAEKPSGEIIDLAGRSDNLITLKIASK
jgi:hypothetical protein